MACRLGLLVLDGLDRFGERRAAADIPSLVVTIVVAGGIAQHIVKRIRPDLGTLPVSIGDSFGVGLFSGAVVGSVGGCLGVLASGVTEQRPASRVIAALVGALSGAIMDVGLITAARIGDSIDSRPWVVPRLLLASMLDSVGISSTPGPVLLLTGMLPVSLAGYLGARPSGTTIATCATCGGLCIPTRRSANIVRRRSSKCFSGAGRRERYA